MRGRSTAVVPGAVPWVVLRVVLRVVRGVAVAVGGAQCRLTGALGSDAAAQSDTA